MTSRFLRPYVEEMSSFTDAPPIFHEFLGAALIGTLLARQSHSVRVSAGVGGTWTNLWVMIVGDSGSDHKSTAIRMMEKILMLTQSELRGPDDMSPEGLLSMFQSGEANPDLGPNLMLVYSEFLNVFFHFRRQYSANLRPMLMDLYDVKPVFRKQLKKNYFEIPEPRCSMVGGIPSELLAQYSQPEDWDGGFLNRFVIVQGKKTRRQESEPSVPENAFIKQAKRLHELMDEVKTAQLRRHNGAARASAIPFSAAAQDISRELHRTIETDYHTIIARGQNHFSKLAAICQVDIDPHAKEISREAGEAALRLVEMWRKPAIELADLCKSSGREHFEGDKLARSVLRYLHRHNGRAHETDVMNNCGMDIDKIKNAVSSLHRAGKIEIFSNDDQTERYVLKNVTGASSSSPTVIPLHGKGKRRGKAL